MTAPFSTTSSISFSYNFVCCHCRCFSISAVRFFATGLVIFIHSSITAVGRGRYAAAQLKMIVFFSGCCSSCCVRFVVSVAIQQPEDTNGLRSRWSLQWNTIKRMDFDWFVRTFFYFQFRSREMVANLYLVKFSICFRALSRRPVVTDAAVAAAATATAIFAPT